MQLFLLQNLLCNVSGYSLEWNVLVPLEESCPSQCECNQNFFMNYARCESGEEIDFTKLSPGLTSLVIANTPIQRWTSEVNFPELVRLEIHNTTLTEIHIGEKMRNLKFLKITNNRLSDFCKIIFKTNLTLLDLDLSGNIMKSPNCIVNLPSVVHLKLEENEFEAFDSFLFKIPSVLQLDLSGNPIKSINLTDNVRSLKKLTLQGCNIKELDTTYFQIPHIKNIDLQSNPLVKLDANYGLENLEQLKLDKTMIEDEENLILNTPNLHTLSMNHAPIKILNNCKGLSALSRIGLQNTSLKSWNSTSCDTSKLQSIDLSESMQWSSGQSRRLGLN